MKGVISYSLFGYGKERQKNSFDFNSYLRGLMVNARVNRIIYPEWKTLLNIDHETLEGQFSWIFKWLEDNGHIIIKKQPSGVPLCKAMLWRLDPCFEVEDGNMKYNRVVARDLDSVCTYREAQAVEQWFLEGNIMHCITDSISHTIPMLGGMVGFRSGYFREQMGVKSLDELIRLKPGMDFSLKGSDQTFMNRIIYPKLSSSATEHFVKGMRHNLKEEDGRHYTIDSSIQIPVDRKFEKINLVCGHIGAAGYYDVQMMQFLREDDPYEEEYKDIEEKFANIFYWRS